MKNCKTVPCGFHMIVDDKVELIMTVHVDAVVMAESDQTCRDIYA